MKNSNLSLISFKAFNRAVIEEINKVRKFPQTYYEKLIFWISHLDDNQLKIPNKPIITLENADSFKELLNFISVLDQRKKVEIDQGLTISSQLYLDQLSDSEIKLEEIKGNSAAQLSHLISHVFKPEGLLGEVISKSISDPEIVVLFLLLNENNRRAILHDKFSRIGVCSGYLPRIDDIVVIIHLCENSSINITESPTTKIEVIPENSDQLKKLNDNFSGSILNNIDNALIQNDQILDYKFSKEIVNTKTKKILLITKIITYLDGSVDHWIVKTNL